VTHAATFAALAAASLRAAKRALVSGDHADARLLAASCRLHANDCRGAADLRLAEDANAVAAAQAAAGEAQDLAPTYPGGPVSAPWRTGQRSPLTTPQAQRAWLDSAFERIAERRRLFPGRARWEPARAGDRPWWETS